MPRSIAKRVYRVKYIVTTLVVIIDMTHVVPLESCQTTEIGHSARVVSLWDLMHGFRAQNLVAIVSNLDALRARHQHLSGAAGNPLRDPAAKWLKLHQPQALKVIHEHLSVPLFSKVIRDKTDRFVARLNDPETSPHVCCTLIDELKADLQSDLETQLFVVVRPSAREYWLQDQPLFGDKVATAFTGARKDIRCAGDCFAYEMWTATVFHLMRVLEHGLRPMADRFGVPFAVDSWHKVIKGIEDGLNALRNKQGLTEQDRNEITYYSDAAAQFRHFKDAWRNHVSHARESYDEADAIKVMTHVREFMQHLAEPI